MRLIYRLDKSFGPGGSFAGLVSVIVGVILLPFYWTGVILLILGAFVGFTASGCEINPGRRLIRPYQLWFGLIKTGSWQQSRSWHASIARGSTETQNPGGGCSGSPETSRDTGDGGVG